VPYLEFSTISSLNPKKAFNLKVSQEVGFVKRLELRKVLPSFRLIPDSPVGKPTDNLPKGLWGKKKRPPQKPTSLPIPFPPGQLIGLEWRKKAVLAGGNPPNLR
jgi:hypothetical protein